MTRTTRFEVVLAYLRLPHALPVTIVIATTAVIAVIIDRNAAWTAYLAIVLAMLGAQVVIGVTNELIDLDLDRAARPDKPLVSGLVSRRGAVIMLTAGLGVMVVAAATLGALPLAICLLGSGLGVAYSLWFKRSLFAFIPYVFAIPLLPVWVALSLGEYDSGWLVLFPLGCFALTGVHIAQSLPDVESDRRAGIVNLTTRLGERRGLIVCWVALAASAVVLVLSRPDRAVAWAAGILAVTAVLLDIGVFQWHPRRGVRLVFPVAAVSTAMLGIAWVYAYGTN
jgi:4-hydroxybenzoate polyprenyltransferase